MTATTCLQYCINGMGKPLFDFAKTKDGKKLIAMSKKWIFIRDNQIKELLIAYNSFFMVQGAIEALKLPKTNESVINFMTSEVFTQLNKDVIDTIEDNYPMLMSCLSRKDKRKLNALFE